MSAAVAGEVTGQTVHVVLPVHNRCALTLKFVVCLRRQAHAPLRLLLIDDGSTDGTSEAVEAEWPGATIIQGDGHYWWAGALQRAFDELTDRNLPDDDVVLIANDDTEFGPDFVSRGVTLLNAHPHSLLCARMREASTGTVRESGICADLLRFRFRAAAEPGEINCLPTRGLFLRWGEMKRIGGFHPRALPHYWSDYEYTMRAYRRGWRLLTDPTLVLEANLATTGYHDLDRVIGAAFVRRLFSPKTPLNPIHRSVFVLLAAPWRVKPFALLNVWARALPRLFWQGIAGRPFPRSLIEAGSDD